MKNCELRLRNLGVTPVLLRAAALVLLGGLALQPPLPARAELPPWVYAEEQRAAPLKLEITVLRVQRWPAVQPARLLVEARVLAVQRQPRGSALRPGDALLLSYPLPEPHASGWVGPAPLPLLRPGQHLPAWLAPDPARRGLYQPAARGRSFGPSLESLQEPR